MRAEWKEKTGEANETSAKGKKKTKRNMNTTLILYFIVIYSGVPLRQGFLEGRKGQPDRGFFHNYLIKFTA